MPDDGLWGPDGERLQMHVRRSVELRGRTLTQGFPNPELGLVITRYYKDEADNKYGFFTEYDVYIIRYQIILRNVPVKCRYQGESGGQQITLKPATVQPDFKNPNDIMRSVMESDGDLVCVEWIGGQWPVIDGCMNHIRAGGVDWQSDSTEGEVASFFYNTTRTHVDKDGNINMDFTTTGSTNDRSLIINVDGVQFLRVYQDSSTGDVRIELGDNTGEKSLLAETFRTWFNNNIDQHNHGVNLVTSGETAGTGVPSLVGHTHTVAGTTGNLSATMPDTHLTDKVKVEG